MPLTAKGAKILKNMRKTYKSDKKAKQVFYSMINEGKVTGAESGKKKRKTKKKGK